jgi:hypothetical protein
MININHLIMGNACIIDVYDPDIDINSQKDYETYNYALTRDEIKRDMESKSTYSKTLFDKVGIIDKKIVIDKKIIVDIIPE